jgi:hypothetical protein
MKMWTFILSQIVQSITVSSSLTGTILFITILSYIVEKQPDTRADNCPTQLLFKTSHDASMKQIRRF